ncbi:MAG TPA: hypothetical protein VF251_14230 [Pyrinomonadaceae bacterium]
MFTSFGLMTALAGSLIAQAQPLRIDSVSPRTVIRGEQLTLNGSFGSAERGKTVRFARVVDRQAEIFYPTILSWTDAEIVVTVPRHLPIDQYVASIVYPERPTRHSNNFIFRVRESPPPAIPGGGDDPVVVLPNWCVIHPPQRSSRVGRDTEKSTGASTAPCESMRSIYGVDIRVVRLGDQITLRGDFGVRRNDQLVAIGKLIAVDSARQGGLKHRLRVSYLLPVVAWSQNRITVRVLDEVNPDDYAMMLVNRLSRTTVPGIFEEGSNAFEIRVRR